MATMVSKSLRCFCPSSSCVKTTTLLITCDLLK
jgi:hypothetical protein